MISNQDNFIIASLKNPVLNPRIKIKIMNEITGITIRLIALALIADIKAKYSLCFNNFINFTITLT